MNRPHKENTDEQLQQFLLNYTRAINRVLLEAKHRQMVIQRKTADPIDSNSYRISESICSPRDRQIAPVVYKLFKGIGSV